MTWTLCLALAVGALVNIQLVLTSQQVEMSWQEKYVLAISAAWPLYIAVGLAVLAAMGAIMDLDSQIASRPKEKEEKAKKISSPREGYKREQDSFVASISAAQHDSAPDEVVDLYPSPDNKAIEDDVTPRDTPPEIAASVHKPDSAKSEADDDLKFFRMS